MSDILTGDERELTELVEFLLSNEDSIGTINNKEVRGLLRIIDRLAPLAQPAPAAPAPDITAASVQLAQKLIDDLAAPAPEPAKAATPRLTKAQIAALGMLAAIGGHAIIGQKNRRSIVHAKTAANLISLGLAQHYDNHKGTVQITDAGRAALAAAKGGKS